MNPGGLVWRSLMIFTLVFCWSDAFARVGIDGATTIAAPLSWTGGDIVYSHDLCVLSTQEPTQSGNTPVPYQVTTITPLTFVMTSGANQIPFTAVWRDLAGSTVHTLTPRAPSGDIFTGLSSGCPPASANARLTLSMSEASLLVAPPGNYTAVFMAWIESSGQGRPRIRVTVNLSLTINGVVRISQLDPINLGTFDGINPLAGSDSLCVFRNFAGPYGVRVTGQGAAGAFVLVNGASQVPVAVTWNDGAGAVTLAPGVLLSARSGAYILDPDCAGGGANNATIGVSATAANMGAATAAGVHSGVLTVMVEVQ